MDLSNSVELGNKSDNYLSVNDNLVNGDIISVDHHRRKVEIVCSFIDDGVKMYVAKYADSYGYYHHMFVGYNRERKSYCEFG